MPSFSGGRDKQNAASCRQEVDALIADDLLKVISMPVGEIAVVAAVPTDFARVILGDVRATLSRPHVRTALGTGCVLDITWRGPGIGEFGPVRLRCRVRPDAVGFPERFEPAEAMADCLPDRDMIGVATAVVPAVGRPELPKLRAAMQTVPVEVDDYSSVTTSMSLSS